MCFVEARNRDVTGTLVRLGKCAFFSDRDDPTGGMFWCVCVVLRNVGESYQFWGRKVVFMECCCGRV
jgi:hypothetical protein